jgi:hypothetical protein
MFGIQIVVSALLTTVALAASTVAHALPNDDNLRAELERVAQRRILFGHQSVGVNLLDGIRQLSATAGVPINIVEVATANEVQHATFGHTFVAENGNPLLKLHSFEQAMGVHRTGLDIALVKLCFIDFDSRTDVKSLFAHYQSTLDALRARNPGTTFVHITAPLTTVASGMKVRIKQLLGTAPPGTAENQRREEYNALLRHAYLGKEPFFDLARIESTAPDGTPATVNLNGKAVPVLLPEYSDDGGHLNATARLRAARELVTVLASIPDQPASR